MLKVFRQVSFLLSFALVWGALHLAIAGEGPGSGGGGGTIEIAGRPHLIDFLNLLTVDELVAIDNASGARASTTPDQTKSFEKVKTVLDAWEDVPMDFVAFKIRAAMDKPLEWKFVNQLKKQAKHHYRSKNLPKDSQITTAAYYTLKGKKTNILIDRGIWNKQSELSQMGLVLHETLRQVQFAHLLYFDDETLQKATSILLLCEPSVKLSQYLNLLTMNFTDEAAERLGSFEDVTRECRGQP